MSNLEFAFLLLEVMLKNNATMRCFVADKYSSLPSDLRKQYPNDEDEVALLTANEFLADLDPWLWHDNETEFKLLIRAKRIIVEHTYNDLKSYELKLGKMVIKTINEHLAVNDTK